MTHDERPLRIAVVGARCRNQGIGEHLARFCVEAGGEVVGVLGTSAATAAEASRTLEAATGRRARAYSDWHDLLEGESPGVLVVASPSATHAPFLERALAARLHVLCEKPLVWEDEDPADRAERLARAFESAGLHLRVNAQWPLTLPAYRTLFPAAAQASATRFFMRLSPRSSGVPMLLDALPHGLSLLHAVLPGQEPRLVDPRVAFEDPTLERARVRFGYEVGGDRIDTTIELHRQREQPRTAAYGFDDCIATRCVEMYPYRFFFEGAGRRIPLPDPTPLLVRSFLDAVASGPPQDVDPAALPGMRLLTEIVRAAHTAPSP